MSGEGGTSCEVELVSCSLSELSSCLCLPEPLPILGSSRRKLVTPEFDISPEELFFVAKRAILTHKPTLIDHLINQNRAAIMGPKRAKTLNANGGVKRKREPEPSAGPSKKMKSNAGDPKKNPATRKAGHKLDPLGIRSQLLKKKLKNAESGKKPYATRISSNKAKLPISLRSGKKVAEKGKPKKPLTVKKGVEVAANVEASSTKSDEEPGKGLGNSSKKEPAVSKKILSLKKDISSPNSNQATKVDPAKKSGNRSDAGGSTTSDKTVAGEEVKKKRRKRKRWSMGMNPLKKPYKKKEPAEPVDEVVEESDEDYGSGRISDTSLMSVATHDSSSLIQPPAASIKEDSLPSAPTEECSVPTKDEPLPVNLKAEGAGDKEVTDCLPGELNGEIVDRSCSKMEETYKTENDKADAVVPVVEQIESVVQQPESVELAADNVMAENVHEATNCELLLKNEPKEINAKVDVESVACGLATPKETPETSKKEESLPNGSLVDVQLAPNLNSVDVSNLPTDPVVESETSNCLVITKCESLANTSMEKCVLNGSISICDPEEVPQGIVVEPTMQPEELPLKKEPLDIDEIIRTDSAEDDEAKLKRDADSTTCDNPKGLDDSFGDLSLYVSEEDLNPEKDQDEGLPDSTNLPQAEPVLPDEQELGDVKIGITEKPDPVECLTEEQKQMKESVLQALGLKSLSSTSSELPEVPAPKRSDGYTGTLKAVIKLNRDKKQMVYKRSDDDLSSSNKLEYRICSEMTSVDGKPVVENKKQEIGEVPEDGLAEPSKESLIIPEKSSSFSIHPGRLCSDVCSYCFGKFGSLDTPCHVAQLKGEERQRKILENEPHLTGESCLCDACYRYVDRKANFPEKLKVGRLKPPAQASICCVTHCNESATRTIKRKWLIKLKKSITNKLNIDMEKLGHGVYYPFCTQHHYWVEYFTVCGICRKRLNRNNLFSLGAEADRLNLMLAEDGIPARLSVNLFLCKLCRYYADLRLKYPDPTAIPNTHQNFYKNYRRKILMSLDLPVSDSDDELLPAQDDPKKASETDSSKADEDMMSLTGLATLLGEQPQQQARIQVKFGNVNIGTLSNLNIGQQGGSAASAATTSTGNASAAAVIPSAVNGATSNHKNEPTYPEVSLIANLEYQGPNTPDGSWERYQSTLQFDKKTKQLWTELQRPYGSQTSFLRHLVMLERVWRDGYLVLAADADEAASRYITSARNRIRAFETQGPKMQTSVPSAVPPPSIPVVTPATACPTPVSRPQPVISKKPQPVSQPFPFLATSEIEVTPIRGVNKPSPNVQVNPPVSKATAAMPRSVPSNPVQRSTSQQFQGYVQQMNPCKKITPLDRAKSLVRMAPLYQQIQQHTNHSPGGERRGPVGTVRYNHSGATHTSIPPLVRLPQTTPTQFYPQPILTQQQLQQQLQQHINQQQSFFQNQPPNSQQLKQLQQKHLLQQNQLQQRKQAMPLPKLPKNLTVMSMPARPSPPQAITLSHAGITIEKQIAPAERRTSSLPIERPSISVFREPATP